MNHKTVLMPWVKLELKMIPSLARELERRAFFVQPAKPAFSLRFYFLPD